MPVWGIISICVSAVSLLGSLGALFVAWGRLTQKQDDIAKDLASHTVEDSRRFTEVSAFLTEIRGDVKDLLSRRAPRRK